MPDDPEAHPPTKRCLNCDYDLRGLPEDRCPECGRPFDPSDSRTYRPRELPGSTYRTAAILGVFLIFPPAILIVLLDRYSQAGASLSHTLLSALAFVSVLAGLSVESVVLCVSARHVLNVSRPAEDLGGFRSACLLSLCVLVVVILGLFLFIPSLQ